MNMKKTVLIAALALCASWGRASELYWTVGSGELDPYNTSDYDVGLYAVWGEYTQNVGNDPRATKLGTFTVEDLALGFEQVSSLAVLNEKGHDLSSYYFFLEISGADGRVAATDKIAYSDLADAIAQGGGMSAPSGNAYEFGSFSADVVPEPTSALLVLVGALALGLKRKKELV